MTRAEVGVPVQEDRTATDGRKAQPEIQGVDIHFDADTGLLPAIVQSSVDDRVLMLGYMDREALAATLMERRLTFFSRSRGRLWHKGETSGNWLEVVEVRVDCDRDALLVRATPHGPTCHTGAASCFETGFSWVAAEGEVPVDGEGIASERTGDEMPSAPDSGTPGLESLGAMLAEIEKVIERRDRERPAGSYTAELLSGGAVLAARKVAEEAVETALAAVVESERVAEESADLLYHLLVLWRVLGVAGADVASVLAARRR